MRRFVNDDSGYLAWVRSHPDGFVVNCERSLNPNSLMLHRASCRTISGVPPRGRTWTGEYIKVCSDSRRELEQFAHGEAGGTLRPCRTCDP